ncbi:MAG: hypothetical protein EON58_19910 [Alphaproteobacteria bacterium]|nr:MAG: hypothetical protein EON58_19910 [Alphaproteobacteria bacterium]
MPHNIMRRGLLILTLAACAGCVNYSEKISQQFELSGKKLIDLKAAVPTDWDRVCFVGPYQDDAFVEKTLGFSWAAERTTSIEDNDGITLLLFVKEQSVLAYVEHPRDHGDFNELEGQCFSPENARFRSFPRGPDNWPRMVPE